MTSSCDGLLLIDKPRGPTSHDVVDRIRRGAQIRRVGHGGTLDPWASGLLPVLLGRATRLARFLPQAPKVYHGTLQFGWSSTTDDVTGQPRTPSSGHPLPDLQRALIASREFLGSQMQRPPAFSARKIDGTRSYRLARRGLPAEGAPTLVEVFRFDLSPTDRPDVFAFEVEVSTGTYIRALARDLGDRLGCGGVLASLVRTRIGPMLLIDALPFVPEEIDRARVERNLIALEALPLVPPPIHLCADGARRFCAGGVLRGVSEDEGTYRVLDNAGRLLGVAEARGGLLTPRVVLPGPTDLAP